MHDPKFENEVQQKMEALEFSPSESVWIRLEEDLKKEKRRSAPLFWLFFLVGGMLLGAGGTWLFFIHAHQSGSSASAISPATGGSTGGNAAATGSLATPPSTINSSIPFNPRPVDTRHKDLPSVRGQWPTDDKPTGYPAARRRACVCRGELFYLTGAVRNNPGRIRNRCRIRILRKIGNPDSAFNHPTGFQHEYRIRVRENRDGLRQGSDPCMERRRK